MISYHLLRRWPKPNLTNRKTMRTRSPLQKKKRRQLPVNKQTQGWIKIHRTKLRKYNRSTRKGNASALTVVVPSDGIHTWAWRWGLCDDTRVLRLPRDIEELDGVAAAGSQQQLGWFRQIHTSVTQCEENWGFWVSRERGRWDDMKWWFLLLL